MSGRIEGNDLRMALVEKVAKHSGPYDTSMLREVFDFCWEQLTWRASVNELQQLVDGLSEELSQ